MNRIIDSHCHIYPEKIAHKAIEAVDHFYGGLPGCPCDGTAETLLACGRAEGISHFIVHSVATKPEQVPGINRFISESVRQADGAFTGLGAIHPDSGQLRQDFEELMALGGLYRSLWEKQQLEAQLAEEQPDPEGGAGA